MSAALRSSKFTQPEVDHMPRAPICPVDRAAMIKGDDGVWRCRVNARHEFRVLGGPAGPLGPLEYAALGNMACPACGADMEPVRGEPGAWVCLAEPGHRLDLHPPLVCVPPAAEELMRDNPWVNRGVAGGPTKHWLSHIGITTPLLPPPQASTGDGSYCQLLGPPRRGGGSKSGRRRKKEKRRKIIPPLEPWGA